MKLLASILPALAFSFVACGGATEQTETAAPAAAPPAQTAHHDHGDLPAQVVAFHDVLAPLWHDVSVDRQAKSCAQTDRLTAAGAKMSEVAAADPTAWAVAVGELQTSIEQLKAACAGNGDFKTTFATVHHGFHKLAEMAGGEHGEHEEHGTPPPMPPAPYKEG